MELLERNALIERHLGLVERLAKARKRRFPRRISYAELMSAGYLGLVQAADRYEQKRGEFDRYASARIVGEMVEYMRELGRWGYGMPEPVSLWELGNLAEG